MTPPEDDRPAPELAAMIDEVRAERPAVDWPRLEAKLFDALDAELAAPALGEAPKRSRRAAWVAGALALAASALFAVTRTPKVEQPTVATVATATTVAGAAPLLADDGRTFVKGAHLEGGTAGLWLRAKDRIAIRVEPGAIATLVDDGTRIRLALDHGAVAADVVPVPGGEPFAVDVSLGTVTGGGGGAVGLAKRVAVHGTKLRVALVSDVLEVSVAEGVAVVGAPRGEDRTAGTDVPAGSVGRFAAGGERVLQDPRAAEQSVFSALLRAPAEPTLVPPTSSVASGLPKAPGKDPATKPAPSSTAPEVPSTVAPPKGLSDAQLAPAFAKLDQELAVCAPSAASGAKTTLEAVLVIHVATDGKAQLDGAEPGLDVKVRECVRSALARVTFPTAEAATTAKKPMVLTAK